MEEKRKRGWVERVISQILGHQGCGKRENRARQMEKASQGEGRREERKVGSSRDEQEKERREVRG
jgi:hypothetical protein